MERSKVFDCHRSHPCDYKPEDQTSRTQYRRDYGRVIHCASFRRMQYKTQLFPGHESDFVRNRLTHSLEVAQIAKTIALNLKERYPDLDLDPDVCEIAGLLHDIGHPPFGHVGEKELNKKMLEYGGFESNAQTLRIITKLEKKERLDISKETDIINGRDKRIGLNLTYRSILSCIKYWQEIDPNDTSGTIVRKGYYPSERDIVSEIAYKLLQKNTPSQDCCSIECQIMDIADDIAYSTYDLEDAFKSGLLNPIQIMNAESEIVQAIKDRLSYLTEGNIIEALRWTFREIWAENVLDVFYEDPLEFTDAVEQDDMSKASRILQEVLSKILRIHKRSTSYADDGYSRVRFFSGLVGEAVSAVDLVNSNDKTITSRVEIVNEEIRDKVAILKEFIMVYLVNSPPFHAITKRQRRIIGEIFDVLNEEDGYKKMSLDYRKIYEGFNTTDVISRKRVLCDYIAGMTDRYAVEFHNRCFSNDKEGITIFRPYY